MTRIRTALVGAGKIGRVHAHTLGTTDRAALSFVYDPNHERAQALARQYGATPVATGTELDHALTGPHVDVVVVASASDTHARHAETALAAGKAVYCEKPLDRDLDAAQRVADWAGHAGVPAVVGFARRFSTELGELRRTLNSSSFGSLRMLRFVSREPGMPPPDYLATSGSIFLDKMIHFFDLQHWLTGKEVCAVRAWGYCSSTPSTLSLDCVDTALVLLQLCGGGWCEIEAARASPAGYEEYVDALGTGGTWFTNDYQHKGATATDSAERFPDMHRKALETFLENVASGRDAEPSFASALRAQRIAVAAEKAWLSGSSVGLAGEELAQHSNGTSSERQEGEIRQWEKLSG